MDRTYHTKIDWWSGLILVVSGFVLVGSGVLLFIDAPPNDLLAAPIAVVCFGMALFTAWIPFSTYYTITATELVVRSTFIHWRVPLESVIEVYPTHNPLSSPACSLDRLRIKYEWPSGRKTSVMISPKAKEEFLAELAEAAGLEWEGNRLIRVASGI